MTILPKLFLEEEEDEEEVLGMDCPPSAEARAPAGGLSCLSSGVWEAMPMLTVEVVTVRTRPVVQTLLGPQETPEVRFVRPPK